jgi:hypothetical protein
MIDPLYGKSDAEWLRSQAYLVRADPSVEPTRADRARLIDLASRRRRRVGEQA